MSTHIIRPIRQFSLALGCVIFVCTLSCRDLTASAQESAPASAIAATTDDPLFSLRAGPVTAHVYDLQVEVTAAQGGRQVSITDQKTGQKVTIDVQEFSIVQSSGQNHLRTSGNSLTFWRGTQRIVEINKLNSAPAPPTNNADREPANPPSYHEGRILSGAVSPDGRTFVTACADRTLRFWDLETGQQVRLHRWATPGSAGAVKTGGGRADNPNDSEIGVVRDETDRVRLVRYTDDGRSVMTISNRLVSVFDAATSRYVRSGALFVSDYQAVAASADGVRLLIASGGAANVWNVPSNRKERSFNYHMDAVLATSMSADGSRGLCSGGYANTDTPMAELLRVWDLNTGEVLFQLAPPVRTVLQGAVSPDGKLVAASDIESGSSLTIWNIETRHKLRAFSVKNTLRQVSFSPSGRLLAAQDAVGTLQVFRVDDAEQIAVFRDSLAPGDHFAWTPKSDALVIGSATGVRRLALPSSAAAGEAPTTANSVPDRDPKSPELHRTQLEFAAGSMKFLNSRPEGLLGPRARLTLIDLQTGRQLKQFTGSGPSQVIQCVALSSDDRLALVGGGQTLNTQRLTLWDIESWRPVRTFDGLDSLPQCVAFTPDGTQALAGTLEGLVHVYDVATAKHLLTYRPGVRSARDVAVAPDGKLAAYAGGETGGQTRLFSLVSGETVRQLTGHVGRVNHVQFLPDGKSLLSVGSDHALKTWDVASGRVLKSMQTDTAIRSFALASGGQAVIAGCLDGSISVWNAASGQLLIQYTGHAGEVTAVGVTGEPPRIVSASNDRTIRFWPLPTSPQSTESSAAPTTAPSTAAPNPFPPFDDRAAHMQRLPSGEIYAVTFQKRPLDGDWDQLAKLPALHSLYLPPEISAAHYARLKEIKSLHTLNVSGKLPAEALPKIAALTNLTTLQLSYTGINDRDLAQLKPLTKLEYLSLPSTRVSDEGMIHLQSHFNLRSLTLSSSLITGTGFKHLSGLVNLENLMLSGSPLTNEGLAPISQLTNLTSLRLSRCNGVGDSGLEHIAKLKKLKNLDLGGTSISDAGSAHLAELVHLESLDLSQTRISDAGLRHLHGLTSLRLLNLRQADVSQAAVTELRDHLAPRLRIIGFDSTFPK